MSDFIVNSSGKLVCPRCGGNDVFQNGSQSIEDSTPYIGDMYCEDCKKHFGASFKLQFTEYDKDDE